MMMGLLNTTAEGEALDYAFATQNSERRIEHLLDWQWEVFAASGSLTGRQYIISYSFEL